MHRMTSLMTQTLAEEGPKRRVSVHPCVKSTCSAAFTKGTNATFWEICSKLAGPLHQVAGQCASCFSTLPASRLPLQQPRCISGERHCAQLGLTGRVQQCSSAEGPLDCPGWRPPALASPLGRSNCLSLALCQVPWATAQHFSAPVSAALSHGFHEYCDFKGNKARQVMAPGIRLLQAYFLH